MVPKYHLHINRPGKSGHFRLVPKFLDYTDSTVIASSLNFMGYPVLLPVLVVQTFTVLILLHFSHQGPAQLFQAGFWALLEPNL